LLPFGKQGFLAEHKLLNYAGAVLGRTAARQAGAQEALYVRDGLITEGTTCNLFACSRGRLITPPVSGLLPGVTRQWVLELAARRGIEVVEAPLSWRRLRGADEAFLTSSVAEVLPLTRIDGRRVGSGAVGPHTRRIQRAYRQLVDQLTGYQRSS
jgi:D-alanine transaminase